MKLSKTCPVLCLVALAAGGCTSYQPLPLDAAAVAVALQPQPIAAVQIAAAAFVHPLLPPQQIDGRDGFSPDEIALMAVIVSPQLRALRAQRGVAQAQVMQAGILPNPQLSYSLDFPRGNSDPTLVNANNLGLSWDVTTLLAHDDNITGAKATVAALDLSIAWQEWQTAQDARLRAFRVLSLEERLPLARQIEDELKRGLDLNREALGKGYRTSGDLVTAAAAWSEARDNRFALEHDLSTDRLALALALGQPPDQVIKLRPAAEFPTLSSDADSAAVLLQGLEKRRLDLVALSLGYESQEATLRAAVKSQFPKIGLSLAKANDTTNVKTLGFGVNIDLPLFDRNQGQIAIAQATRQQLFDEYVARVSEARGQVAQILSDLAATRAEIQEVEESLPDLQQRLEALTSALTDGRTDILTVSEASGALATQRIALGKLRQDLLELSVALEIATGRPLLNRSATP